MTANVIGSIQSVRANGGVELAGQVLLPLGHLDFHLVQARVSNNPRAPSHRIMVQGEDGDSRLIGSAWTKTMKRHGRDGEQFLTLTFVAPSFPKPLHVVAFREGPVADWQICFPVRHCSACARLTPPTGGPRARFHQPIA